MSTLKDISLDIQEMIESGYSDEEISKSIGTEMMFSRNIISYIRDQSEEFEHVPDF